MKLNALLALFNRTEGRNQGSELVVKGQMNFRREAKGQSSVHPCSVIVFLPKFKDDIFIAIRGLYLATDLRGIYHVNDPV